MKKEANLNIVIQGSAKASDAIAAMAAQFGQMAKAQTPVSPPPPPSSGAVGPWQFFKGGRSFGKSAGLSPGLVAAAQRFGIRMTSWSVLEQRARKRAEDDPVIAELWRRHDEQGGYSCTLEELDKIIEEVG